LTLKLHHQITLKIPLKIHHQIPHRIPLKIHLMIWREKRFFL
jgi:hypothetical protein